MMSKLKKGQNYRGAVHYALNEKKGAEIIGTDGVMLGSIDSISRSFEMQGEINPRLGKNCGHTVLSFSPHDAPRISNEYMLKIALEYMERMGIKDTQFIIVRHYDRPHPHCHIVFNRVSNSGKTISDSNERFRSKDICLDITQREGLYMAPGKEEVNRHRLREPDKTRYRIYDIIQAELPHHRDFDTFIEAIERQGIECTIINNGSTNKQQGIRFKMGKYTFNGSEIDRSCSLSKLKKAIEANSPKVQNRPQKEIITPVNSHYEDRSQDLNFEFGLFKVNQQDEYIRNEDCAWYRPKKKKKKGIKR